MLDGERHDFGTAGPAPAARELPCFLSEPRLSMCAPRLVVSRFASGEHRVGYRFVPLDTPWQGDAKRHEYMTRAVCKANVRETYAEQGTLPFTISMRFNASSTRTGPHVPGATTKPIRRNAGA